MAWVRHYAGLMCAMILLGAALAGAYLTVVPSDYEAWTIITQTNNRIPLTHLDSVAAAVFDSQAVYQPAVTALGVQGSPIQFLRDHAQLRSVPDSNTLIVVGRASTVSSAKAISSAFANSLVRAFATRSGAQFAIFGRSQPSPVPARLGTKTGIVLGGVVGLWVGLAASLIHFRTRRPVLNLASADDLLGPDHTTVLRRGSRWARMVRRASTRREGRIDERRLLAIHQRVEDAASGTVRLVLACARRSRRSRIVQRLTSVVGALAEVRGAQPGGRTLWLVACDASTSRGELADVRNAISHPAGQDRSELELIWLR